MRTQESHSTPPAPARNVDNDKHFKNPKAWARTKQVWIGNDRFGGGPTGRALTALDRFCKSEGLCPRDALANAVRMYLSLSEEARKYAAYWACELDQMDLHPLPRVVDTSHGAFAVELSPFRPNLKYGDEPPASIDWFAREIVISRRLNGDQRAGQLQAVVEHIDRCDIYGNPPEQSAA